LTPKRHKDIIKDIIKEHDIDETFLDNAASFYWKDVRIKLADLENPRIFINKLGTFHIKIKKLEEYLRDFGSYVASMKDIVYASDEKKKSMKDYYKLLQNIKWQVDRDEKKKQTIRKKQHERKKTTGPLEKQKPDPGGDEE